MNLRASDPRDHIFGLFGLSVEVFETALPLLITPDYSKSVSNVFIDFSLYYLKRDLRVLSAIHALRGRTWRALGGELTTVFSVSQHGVPQEHLPADHPTWTLWDNDSTEWANETLGLSEQFHFTENSNLRYPPYQAGAFKHLNLSGHCLGRLSLIEPYYSPSDMTSDTSVAFTRLFDKSTNRQFNESSGLGDPHQRKPMPHDPRRHWDAHYGEAGMANSLPCANDCYFHATNDLRGLCSAGTRAGNIVATFYGGPVPYLIQETEIEGQYVFVGECFLEGKMDQNLLLPFEEAGRTSEEFVLV